MLTPSFILCMLSQIAMVQSFQPCGASNGHAAAQALSRPKHRIHLTCRPFSDVTVSDFVAP